MDKRKIYLITLSAVVLLYVTFTLNTKTSTSDVNDNPVLMIRPSPTESSRPPTRRLPDALVVGAGKCGTEAIITYLSTSDEYAISNIHTNLKEINFYNYHYNLGKDWYLNQMPLASEIQVLVEKCAPYMWNPVVPYRVRETKADTKIIMVLCDPVKRLVSLYAQKNSYGMQILPDFTAMIHIVNGTLVEEPDKHMEFSLLKSGTYSEFIKLWLQYFTRDQMLFVSGENLVENPLAEVSKVTEFLGKPNAITSNNIYYNESRGFYCFQKNQGDQWCMDPARKGRKHPIMPKYLLDALHEHFKPYNNQLKDLIGQDFGWPSYFGQH